MLTKIFNRIVNYAVSPIIQRILNFGEHEMRKITPEQWNHLFVYISWVMRPLLFVSDLVRVYVVWFYVRDPIASRAVNGCIESANKVLYDHKLQTGRPPPPPLGTLRLPTNAKLYLVVVVLSPMFFVTDIIRLWLCHLTVPELADHVDSEVDAAWSITYGAHPRGKS